MLFHSFEFELMFVLELLCWLLKKKKDSWCSNFCAFFPFDYRGYCLFLSVHELYASAVCEILEKKISSSISD